MLCKTTSLASNEVNGSYDTVWEIEAEVKTAAGILKRHSTDSPCVRLAVKLYSLLLRKSWCGLIRFNSTREEGDCSTL